MSLTTYKPGVLTLTDPARWLFESKADFLLWISGRGAGKNFAYLLREMWFSQHFNNFKSLLFRAKYTEQAAIFDEMDRISKEFISGGKNQLSPDKRQHLFPNGSKIRLGAADSKATISKFQGWNANHVAIDESGNVKEDVQERIPAICRSPEGGYHQQITHLTNPGGIGQVYLRKKFIDPARAINKYGNIDEHRNENLGFYHWKWDEKETIHGNVITRKMEMIQTTLYANPAINHSEYIAKLGSMSPMLRRMWIDCDLDAAEGQFLGNVNLAVEDVEIDEHDMFSIGIDPGFNCTGVIWCAVSPDGVYKIYDCEEYRRLSIQEKVPFIHTRNDLREKELGFKIRNSLHVIDVAARQHQEDGGVTTAQQYQERGLPVVSKAQRRVDGWELIRTMIDEGRLKISPKCKKLIVSLNSLETSEFDPEDCVKQDPDHLADALRYLLVYYHRFTGDSPETKQQKEYKEYVKNMSKDPRILRLLGLNAPNLDAY